MLNSKLRFVAAVAAILVVGFFATSLISYFVAEDTLSTQMAETTLPLTSDNIYSEIQKDLLRPVFIASLMAQSTFVRDWALGGEVAPERMVHYLKEIQQRYNTVTAFFVSDKTGAYYHPRGLIKTVTSDDPLDAWYFRVRAINDEYEVNVDHDTADPTRLTIFINYRVHDFGGNFIGITGVGLAVDAVHELIKTYQNRYGRQIYFADRQGTVTLQGDDYKGAKSLRESPGLGKLATQILASPSGTFTFERDGKTIYLNTRLVSEFDWYLLVEQEEDPAIARVLNALLGNLALSVITTIIVLLIANMTIGGYQSRLEEMATTDKLTGATSRQAFDPVFDHLMKAARRSDSPLTAVALDIDHFKDVNDTYGHLAGDAVIHAIADIARNHIRESDIVCRWGGEEFLLLLHDCDIDQGLRLAEKICMAVKQCVVAFEGNNISVTVSLGIAQHRPDEEQFSLVNRADRALYAAKAAGRDRVEVSET